MKSFTSILRSKNAFTTHTTIRTNSITHNNVACLNSLQKLFLNVDSILPFSLWIDFSAVKNAAVVAAPKVITGIEVTNHKRPSKK